MAHTRRLISSSQAISKAMRHTQSRVVFRQGTSMHKAKRMSSEEPLKELEDITKEEHMQIKGQNVSTIHYQKDV